MIIVNSMVLMDIGKLSFCMGNVKHQDTFKKPYGNQTNNEPFIEQTTLRFFRTSIDLHIDGSKFTPLSESYSKPDVKHYRVESSKGVTIHYRIVPETTKYYRPIVNGLIDNTRSTVMV